MKSIIDFGVVQEFLELTFVVDETGMGKKGDVDVKRGSKRQGFSLVLRNPTVMK
jgi:hypothetical protein